MSVRVVVVVGAIALGCGGTHAPTASPKPASTPIPIATESDPNPSVSEAAPSSSISVTLEPVATSVNGSDGNAPCDFQRLYRGSVGKTGLSVYLQKSADGAALSGSVHYDNDRPALAIERGRTSGVSDFEFSEKGGGSFRGSCNRENGELRGTYRSAKKSQPFTLNPRPKSWPPLYGLVRKTEILANHPNCKARAKRDEATEIDIGRDESALCLPTNPKKRSELVAEGIGTCTAEDFGARVWSFAPKIVAGANLALASSYYEEDAKHMKRCWNTATASSNTVILFARDGVLTVQEAHSEYFGGAHPFNTQTGGITVDLTTGASVRLEDIVLRPDDLKRLLVTCIAPFERYRDLEKPTTLPIEESEAPVSCADGSGALYLWGCDKDSMTSPKWALVEGGIAIFANGNPHVTAIYDGMGPIIGWDVLLREKLLKPDSPVARLWKDVEPAPPASPACSSGFAGSRLVKWRELP